MVKNLLLEMQHRVYVNNVKLRLEKLLNAQSIRVSEMLDYKTMLVLLGVDLYTQYGAALEAAPEPNVVGVRYVMSQQASSYLKQLESLLSTYKYFYSSSMHAKPSVEAVAKPNYKPKPKRTPKPPKRGKRASKAYRCYKAKQDLWALAERMEVQFTTAEKQQLPFVAKCDPEFRTSWSMELQFRVWSQRDDIAAGDKEVRKRHAVQVAFLSTLYDRLKPTPPPPPNLKVVGGRLHR